MDEKQGLTSSMEDYLEAIAHLKEKNGVTRVRDLSEHLKVKTPSVTGALSMLSKRGLVVHERYGFVDLTARGERIAQSVQARHDMLIRFLRDVLKLKGKTVEEDACRMEHTISKATYSRLEKFVLFCEAHPKKTQSDWASAWDQCINQS